MDPRHITTGVRLSRVAGAAMFAVVEALAGTARAACIAPTTGAPLQRQLASSPLGMLGLAPGLAAGAPGSSSQGGGPIVGLWRALMTLEDGSFYDEGFQQFHSDGTELMVSAGVPPTIGNVCIGVWERGPGGTISLRHVTWNWNGDEVLGDSPTGYFLLEVTLRTNSRGNGYSGTWRAASYDLDAAPGDPPQPGTEAEGTVNATRITVQ